MSHGHPIWFLLTWACVVWYSTITIYVAIKGSIDIRQMLRRLQREHDKDHPPPP